MTTKLFLAAVVAATAVLAGCSSAPSAPTGRYEEGIFMTTPRARMSIEDLNMYRLDCNRAEEQLEFLRYHIPTKKEKYGAAMGMTSIVGQGNEYYRGTWNDTNNLLNGRYAAVSRVLIAQLLEKCQREFAQIESMAPGCLHLEESMTPASSAGRMCVVKNGSKYEKSTHWEANVDN